MSSKHASDSSSPKTLFTLEKFFRSNATKIFDAREKEFKKIRTPGQVRKLQKNLRSMARGIFGEYVLDLIKSDTPPRILRSGNLARQGVVIEKFLFEIFPKFWGTALLYRPEGNWGRCPAVVMPVGHWWDGKSCPMYQRLMHLLASRGIICVSLDNCGQGERITHFDPVLRDCATHLSVTHPKGREKPYPIQDAACHGFWQAKNVTSSHCLVGDPGYLCGVHQHALTAAAGKRLVDLLISRKDVDPMKIGACGASGGGGDTRFLLTLDERIRLAVPTSILNGNRAFTAGDADQSFFFTLNQGISPIDLLVCLAPHPLLIISSSKDNHDSAGVARFYRPFWDAFGKGHQITHGTGKGPHGFPLPSRKIIAEFILKHFREDTSSIRDSEHSDDLPLPSQQELRTTIQGNVYFDRIGKSPMELIHERALHLQKTRQPATSKTLRKTLLKLLREEESALFKIRPTATHSPREIRWKGEGSVPLQIQLQGHSSPFRLFAHEFGGVSAEASPISSALKKIPGQLGLFDFRGVGPSNIPGKEYQGACISPMLMGKQARLARIALHQGRTLPGMRVVDLLQAARILAHSHDSAPLLIAEGGMGLIALMAAFLKPDAFQKIYLYQSVLSWTELTSLKPRSVNFAFFLHGVLEKLDLPDLTRHLPAGLITWINPVDAASRVILPNQAQKIHPWKGVSFHHARTENELIQLLS